MKDTKFEGDFGFTDTLGCLFFGGKGKLFKNAVPYGSSLGPVGRRQLLFTVCGTQCFSITAAVVNCPFFFLFSFYSESK